MVKSMTKICIIFLDRFGWSFKLGWPFCLRKLKSIKYTSNRSINCMMQNGINQYIHTRFQLHSFNILLYPSLVRYYNNKNTLQIQKIHLKFCQRTIVLSFLNIGIILDPNHFTKLGQDLTCYMENKVQ